MVNPLKGEAAVTLEDGRQLVLVLDMEALIEAEAAYGKPMRVVMQEAAQEFVGAMRALLFGALRAHHREFTLRDAGALFASSADAEAIAAALGDAAEAGFSKPAAAEGKEGAHPPGASSGASGAKPASTRKPSGGKRRARSD